MELTRRNPFLIQVNSYGYLKRRIKQVRDARRNPFLIQVNSYFFVSNLQR